MYSPTFLSPFLIVGAVPGWHYDVYMNVPAWQEPSDSVDANFAAFVIEQRIVTREGDPRR